MKNLIMFFVLVMVMVFSNYEVSYSQEVKTGNFYFLVERRETKEPLCICI